jgi:hypothetical protein
VRKKIYYGLCHGIKWVLLKNNPPFAREVGWWCGLLHTVTHIGVKKENFMELYLQDGWHLINPREIRSVKYFQRLKNQNSNEYSPDTIFKDEYIEQVEKIIRIEMFDKTNGRGNREQNILEIPVNDDDLFNYIYKNLSRKFNLRIRNKVIEEDNVIKLYEKGLTKEEITKILHIKFTLVENIIEKYKNKKNGI